MNKEIEELAELLRELDFYDWSPSIIKDRYYLIAEHLILTGYHKESESIPIFYDQVRKQAIKEFLQAIDIEYILFDDMDEVFFSCLREDLKNIAKDFGVNYDF